MDAPSRRRRWCGWLSSALASRILSMEGLFWASAACYSNAAWTNVRLLSGCTFSLVPVARLGLLCLGEWLLRAGGLPEERHAVLRRTCCRRASSGPLLLAA